MDINLELNKIDYAFSKITIKEKDINDMMREYSKWMFKKLNQRKIKRIKIIEVENELEYKLVILELVTKLNDTHARIEWDSIIEKWKGENIAPYEVSFVEEKLVVTDIYDVIDTINANNSIQVGYVII